MADNEYSQYYEAFVARLATGEGLAPEDCRCQGGGWILSDVDTWHQCPDHYAGQRHPEDDEPPSDVVMESDAPISPEGNLAGEDNDEDVPF